MSVTVVNLVKDKPIPIKKGTTKNITKQSNVGRTNTGKYFFIGLFSVFISSPIISQRGLFTSTLTLKHIHNKKHAVIKRVCTANIQIKHRVLFFVIWVAFCFAKNRLFGVSLSLQPLPSLRSVQWPPSALLLSLPRLKSKNRN